MEKKTVLVTGIGGNVGQGIIRNIGKTCYPVKIIGTNMATPSAGTHLCDVFYQTPYSYEENYIEKIIEPIQSRCQTFQITPPTKKDVAIQMSKILKSESVEFDPKDLVPIIDSSYPDIRKIINTCQLNSLKGKLQVDVQNLLDNDYKLKVLEVLKSNDDKRNKYMKVRQAIIDSKATDFSDLYTILYDKVDEYAGDNTAGVILLLGDGVSKSAIAIDKEIIAASTLIQILNTI